MKNSLYYPHGKEWFFAQPLNTKIHNIHKIIHTLSTAKMCVAAIFCGFFIGDVDFVVYD